MMKRIHELKTGDTVKWYGSIFRITQDAQESRCHRPMLDFVGPSAVAVANAVCIREGVGFSVGVDWEFQGNHRAAQLEVCHG